MTFAALEAKLNSSVMKHLANAIAVIDGRDIPVIFDAEYKLGTVGQVGMGAAEPQMIISAADVPAEFVGTTITVNGAAWNVAERRADGQLETGLTLVILEKP